jgi:hypothetical protein
MLISDFRLLIADLLSADLVPFQQTITFEQAPILALGNRQLAIQ